MGRAKARDRTRAVRAEGIGPGEDFGAIACAILIRVGVLRVGAEESDLSFAEFGGSKRLYPAPDRNGEEEESSKPLEKLVELRGIEPLTLRLPA